MTKPLLLLVAAGLTLSACAQPQPARVVYLSGPGHQHYFRSGGDRVIIVRSPGRTVSVQARADARRHAEEARRHAREARRLALLSRPDPAEMARIRREALAAGEAGRRAGELARRHGEIARLRGEEARRRGEAIRQQAERLRAQCERGEIRCEIIITD